MRGPEGSSAAYQEDALRARADVSAAQLAEHHLEQSKNSVPTVIYDAKVGR